jgi:hypothetical protein
LKLHMDLSFYYFRLEFYFLRSNVVVSRSFVVD